GLIERVRASTVIKAGGRTFAEVPLSAPAVIDVPGPLGATRIEIQPGRARVATDPGPRQYCVRQGWLSTAGAVAICAPNQVSLALSGRRADYDSLAY
ncbi:MAG: NusG domain II-containing protein, partial [Zoogloea sp.]|nr:NusG domain II-containing protein [Zoogloea sp.]